MANFRFEITAVFPIRGGTGLIVTGRVLQGVARPGAVLRDETSGRTLDLIGIDLACPRPPRARHDVGLVMSPAVQDLAAPGRIWVADRDQLR